MRVLSRPAHDVLTPRAQCPRYAGAPAAHCTLQGTFVKGTVKVESGARLDAVGARIVGNLQCKENRPAPTGGRNVVGGDKEDQCARL